MCSEGCGSCMVCVCLSTILFYSIYDYSCAAGYDMAYEHCQEVQCHKCSKSIMATFKLEKLTMLLTKLLGPTHQLVLHMHIIQVEKSFL